jgi:hypothetical protein
VAHLRVESIQHSSRKAVIMSYILPSQMNKGHDAICNYPLEKHE